MSTELILNDDDLFNRVMNMPPEKLMTLIFKQTNENKNEVVNIKKDIIEIVRDNQEDRENLNKVMNDNQFIKDKLNYINDDEFVNLTNVGMDFIPQISDKAMSIVLRWLGLTRWNAEKSCYVPNQRAYNDMFARESSTEKAINGKSRITYKWNSKKVQKYFIFRLKKAELYYQFETLLGSSERNEWIRNNLLV